MKCLRHRPRLCGGWVGGGGCILIIASALWSRVFRIGLVNVMKCIRERPDLDQELDNVQKNRLLDWLVTPIELTFCF